MDNRKVGELIRKLRKENHLTQVQLAEKLHVSDKTISKWERGAGSPEVSLMTELSHIFEVDIETLISGELNRNHVLGGNMKKMKFYVCPDCGNLITSMTDASITCCGRKLKPMTPVKASEEEQLSVDMIENDYCISSTHEMTRVHYISFVAFMTYDAIMLKQLYPEWDLQVRIPRFGRGKLLWYCSQHGLFYQNI